MYLGNQCILESHFSLEDHHSPFHQELQDDLRQTDNLAEVSTEVFMSKQEKHFDHVTVFKLEFFGEVLFGLSPEMKNIKAAFTHANKIR